MPSLDDLLTYVKAPLAEMNKVPLLPKDFDILLRTRGQRMVCNIDDVQMLFRSSESDRADDIWDFVNVALKYGPPDNDSTEASFHNFWDENIRRMLESVLTCRVIRDSTSTRILRPDFAVLLGGNCAFRGEEKSPMYRGRHPRVELLEKLRWTYDPAPYVLGYYAIGPQVTFVAIAPSQVVDLVSVDLAWRAERIKCMVYIIKLCSVIAALGSIIQTRTTPEYVALERPNGTVISVGAVIHKQYTQDNGATSVRHLVDIYNLLKQKNVPNVDHLEQYFINDTEHGSAVYLGPKSIDNFPRLLNDVVDAVTCVLEALIVMHEHPNPVLHRDIRWPNIVRDAGNPRKWFLVDWDDSSTWPTHAAMHLDARSHSQAVFQDNHGAEVDIWAVGKLLTDAAAFTSGIPLELIAVGERMVEGQIKTATEGLMEVRSIGDSV